MHAICQPTDCHKEYNSNVKQRKFNISGTLKTTLFNLTKCPRDAIDALESHYMTFRCAVPRSKTHCCIHKHVT